MGGKVWLASFVLSELFKDYVDWEEEKAIQTKLVKLHSFYLESNPNCEPDDVMSFIIDYLMFMKEHNLDFTKL